VAEDQVVVDAQEEDDQEGGTEAQEEVDVLADLRDVRIKFSS
jgi:hypothetical protein